jgi:CRISPR/Cas system CSM-associated protein Csm3 (group 7 of RAMP superfamily)
MHSTFYNFISIQCKIEPISSLLIGSGSDSIDPTKPDNSFVRMKKIFRTNAEEKALEFPYLPGSSIKGFLNSAYWMILSANNLLRETSGKSRSQSPDTRRAIRKYKDNGFTYRFHDALERTFGSTKLKGRFIASDFLPWSYEEKNEEAKIKAVESIVYNQRTGNAIDRHTGSCINKALFDLEVIDSGQFYGLIQFYNYQIWQLYLFSHIIQLINDGFLRLGASKTRGLGQIAFTPLSVNVIQKESESGKTTLNGLGKYYSSPSNINDLIDPKNDEFTTNLCTEDSQTFIPSYQSIAITNPVNFFDELRNKLEFFQSLQNSNLQKHIMDLWKNIHGKNSHETTYHPTN